MVAAGGFVVTAAYGFVEWVAGWVNVTDEAVSVSAVGTGVSGSFAGVGFEAVLVLCHGFSGLE